MPTFIYKTADGKRCPSVTTINKIGQDSGGLIHWAWNLGMEQKDYRNARDQAAEGGTVGHALVDAAIHGTEADLSGYSPEAQSAGQIAFGAYKEFMAQTRMEIVASEVPLVHEELRYGGCIDAVGRGANGQLCILDWKTGHVYADHLCQVAAYAELWENSNPADLILGGAHLCRFNRETGDFSHHYFADLYDAFAAFKLKRELYDLLAKLKKRV